MVLRLVSLFHILSAGLTEPGQDTAGVGSSGAEPRGLCMSGKCSTNQATFVFNRD